MDFGTGAVKLTPAHDPNDNLCAKRHNLELIVIFNEDGQINKHGGAEFEGMMRYDARIAIEEALDKLGLFHGKESHKMRLGLCSRSGDIIEPMLTPQWYVNCNSMAKRATDAVRQGEMKIVPESEENTWYKWLDNIRDWCVSRQLWWGHRIPAYFARIAGESRVDKNDEDSNIRWFVARSEAEALTQAAAALKVRNTHQTVPIAILFLLNHLLFLVDYVLYWFTHSCLLSTTYCSLSHHLRCPRAKLSWSRMKTSWTLGLARDYSLSRSLGGRM